MSVDASLLRVLHHSALWFTFMFMPPASTIPDVRSRINKKLAGTICLCFIPREKCLTVLPSMRRNRRGLPQNILYIQLCILKNVRCQEYFPPASQLPASDSIRFKPHRNRRVEYLIKTSLKSWPLHSLRSPGTRAHPTSCGAVLGKIKRALLRGVRQTRFAGFGYAWSLGVMALQDNY